MLRQFLLWLLSFTGSGEVIFSKIKTEGLTVTGDITMVKMELDQSIEFTATPLDRRGREAKIEEGSAEWMVVAVDVDGNDVSDEIDLEPMEDNELAVRLVTKGTECVVTLTLRADGDPDADEVVDIVGAATIIVDSPNVATFELTPGTPTDVEEVKSEPATEDVTDVVDEAVSPTEAPVEDAPTATPVDEAPAEETPASPTDQPADGGPTETNG